MKNKVEDFKRRDLFNYFHEETNPFLYVTTRINITNIYNKCRHYYPSIAFFLHQAIERVDNFKYRLEGDDIYFYDKLRINLTEKKEDNNIVFFDVKCTNNYHEFMDEYLTTKERALKGENVDVNSDQGEIWYTCNPWFTMTQVLSPFNKKVTIPQIIWDKFVFEGDNVYINLTMMVHHGFCDAFHLSEVLRNFEEIVENIDDYLKK